MHIPYTSSAPGIKEIRVIRRSDMPKNSMAASIAGGRVILSVDYVSIPTLGRPSLDWTIERKNGSIYEVSELKFTTAVDYAIPLFNEDFAIVVITAGGNQYLIGAPDNAAIVIEEKARTGNPSSDAYIRDYTLKHTAKKSVLPCIL